MNRSFAVLAFAACLLAGVTALWCAEGASSPQVAIDRTVSASPSIVDSSRVSSELTPQISQRSDRIDVTSDGRPKGYHQRATIELRGSVECSGADLSAARVLVFPRFVHEDIESLRRWQDPRASVGLDGTFELDLTFPIALLERLPSALMVKLEHPQLCADTVRIPLELDYARLQRAEPIALSARLVCRATCVLHGRVPQELAPWQLVGVMAFEMLEGELVPRSSAEVRVGDARTFDLPVSQSAHYAVVALADEFRPLMQQIDTPASPSMELPDLRFERGSSISGVVRRNGAPMGMPARVTAEARAQHVVRVSAFDRGFLWWVNGSFERPHWGATTREDGSFEIPCLGELDHEIRIFDLDGRPVLARPVLFVKAPAVRADIDVKLCEITVEVVRNGAPVANSSVDLRHVDLHSGVGRSIHTNQDGAASFWLEPGHEATIRIEQRELQVTGGKPGECQAVRVDL